MVRQLFLLDRNCHCKYNVENKLKLLQVDHCKYMVCQMLQELLKLRISARICLEQIATKNTHLLAMCVPVLKVVHGEKLCMVG